MPKIIIKELERDDEPTYDLWAVIEIQSESMVRMVEFQLELLVHDWDVGKLTKLIYKQRFQRWQQIAHANRFDFEVANNAYIPTD